MINRYYKDIGKTYNSVQNELKVLIEHAETERTETGWCCYTQSMELREIVCNNKDLVYYFTDGEGEINLGEKTIPVKIGNLLYVPSGTIHQIKCEGENSLCFLQFSCFNASKTGNNYFSGQVRKAKFFLNHFQGKVYEFGSNSTTLLLERNDTNEVELALIRWPEGNKGAMVAHKDKEQTFFIISGKGEITIDDCTEVALPGHVFFVPRNAPHTSKATEGELTYLCLNSLVSPADDSFESMYKRVIPERMERWRNGIDEVGE